MSTPQSPPRKKLALHGTASMHDALKLLMENTTVSRLLEEGVNAARIAAYAHRASGSRTYYDRFPAEDRVLLRHAGVTAAELETARWVLGNWGRSRIYGILSAHLFPGRPGYFLSRVFAEVERLGLLPLEKGSKLAWPRPDPPGIFQLEVAGVARPGRPEPLPLCLWSCLEPRPPHEPVHDAYYLAAQRPPEHDLDWALDLVLAVGRGGKGGVPPPSPHNADAAAAPGGDA